MRRWTAFRSTLVTLVILFTLVGFPLFSTIYPARAATITVNSTADNGPGNCSTTCTLRDALFVASTIVGATTISFDPNVFNVPRTITLTSGTLTIQSDYLTINGPGANLLAI